MKKDMYAYIMIIAVVSFLGFAVENIWLSFIKGFMDNRNMFFPFLLGYGLAVIGIFAVLGTPMEPRILGYTFNLTGSFSKLFVYFFLVMVSVSLGEIILGYSVELVCGMQWWDYTDLPLHFTRYTSVPTSAAFSLIITLFMRFCFMPLYKFFMSWDDSSLKVVALTIGIIMTADLLYNFTAMLIRGTTKRRWVIRIDDTRAVLRHIHAR